MTDDTPSANPLPPTGNDDEDRSAEFAKALEEHEKSKRSAAAATGAASDVAVGSKVKGKIVTVGAEHLLLDFGGRSEAVAETRLFRAADGTPSVAVGDVLELFVVENGDQIVLAPSIHAEAHAARAQVRAAKAAGVPVSGRVTGVNGGGLDVDLGGLRGFCPVSQIEAGYCENPSVYVGRTLEFLVTSVEEGHGGAVLSRRQLLRRAQEEEARRMLAALKPGDERDGTVRRLEAFGAFVDLGGVDGLVHVSEIRHEHTVHPRDALREGEKVRVRVLRIEPGKEGRQRIALSMKAAAPDPWIGIESRFSPGARVRGVVARLTEFGAFVTLAPGIDGLVHVSEISHERIAHPKNVLVAGQEVEVLVLAVDPAKKRVSLSIKQTTEGPELEEPATRGPRREGRGAPSEGRSAQREGLGGSREGQGAPREGQGAPREGRGAPREGQGAPREGRGGPREGRGTPREGRGTPREGRRAPREERGPGRPGRGEGPREERPRRPDSGGGHAASPPPAVPKAPEGPTTMAIALRKAMEEAKRKQKESGPAG